MDGPTSNHAEIWQWAARHQASPAEISPGKFDGEPSILHFLFGELRAKGTAELHPISWDDFFARFDLMGLTLVYDETPMFELLHKEHPAGYSPGRGHA